MKNGKLTWRRSDLKIEFFFFVKLAGKAQKANGLNWEEKKLFFLLLLLYCFQS